MKTRPEKRRGSRFPLACRLFVDCASQQTAKKMLKRFDRYVSRGADDDKNDDDLLEEIYMPGE